MPITLETRAPQTRCYRCGSTDLACICHHCGRAMCHSDGPPSLEGAAKPRNKEFAKLGLPEIEPSHCDDCRHVVKGSALPLMIGGSSLAMLGIAVMFASVLPGLVMLLVGGGLAGFGYRLETRRKQDASRTRPPLPVVPHIDSTSIRETVRGQLTLDRDGHYRTSIEPVRGRMSIAMTFGRPDQDRLRSYRGKYLLAGEDIEFSAGFAVLRGQAGIRFEGEQFPGGVIPLSGRVSDQPFLASSDAREGAQWRFDLKHRLRVRSEIDTLPLWLTPSLQPESDQRTLNLELQWVGFGPDETPLELDQVGPLTLRVPVAWGNVESVNKRATVGTEDDPDHPGERVRVVEWRRPPLDTDDMGRRRLTLVVRFENRINLDDTIRGTVETLFKGALSGLRGLQIYHPLGGKRTDYQRRMARTEVSAAFELSLAGLRYQDLRVVPDQNKIEDASRVEADEFPGVIPDHETVIDLTNAMSDDGYYVKRIIENPPRSGGRADIVNRYWDIAGRHYDAVYPVDFNLILTGEEVHRGDIRPEDGNTKVRLTVQGAYANDEMERAIEQRWDALHELTADTLKRRTRTPATKPSRISEPARAATDSGSRRESVRKRLDELTDALLERRISEELYREISARLQREMGEIS